MARALTGGRVIDLRVADEGDDADLRAMLRGNPMPSWVTMTVEREPSFLDSLNRFGCELAVIARDNDNGSPVGMYSCAEHHVHIDGQPTTLGYLGGLRVNPAYRHRLRVLREGYASIRALSGVRNPSLWYTSVAAENAPARRLLEAGLPGLPRYVALGELVTLALPRERGRRLGLWRRPKASEIDSLCALHSMSAARYQLSPVLTPEWINSSRVDFLVRGGSDRITACSALWNQQAYKQVVARAYRWPLATGLPLYNAWARLTRRITLPPLNQPLDQCFLAFFASDTEDAREVVLLVRDALANCPSAVLTLGLHGTHPALPALLRAFRPASYRTIIYAVCFDQPPQWGSRPVQPEVAIL